MTTGDRVFPRVDAAARDDRTSRNINPSGGDMSEIDPDSAAMALSDIARVERRALEASRFADVSHSCFLWAGLTTFGYLIHQFHLGAGQWAWVLINVAGIAGMALLGFRNRAGRVPGSRGIDHRPSLVQGTVLIFGSVGYLILTGGRAEYRVTATYFPTVFMFGLIVTGLWIGRIMIVVGVTVTLLVLAVFLWSGPWFDYLMALCVGGVLAAEGVWFRRMDTTS